MKLAQALFTQGFGTRRDCAGLAVSGRVRFQGRVLTDPDEDLPDTALVLNVDGLDWPVCDHALVLLHKPAGYECSQKPKAWPSVLSLLPPPLRTRGVQPVGRLDADTTGLLLLTDDGALIHRWTSPKKHVPKVYEVRTARPVTQDQLDKLLAGVVLEDDPKPVRAAAVQATGEMALQLTLTEGKYHQVKRMVAAAGNHVEGLHRSRFGALVLPSDLAPGQWRWVTGGAAAV